MQGVGETETLSLIGKSYPFRSMIPCDLRKFTRSQVKEYFLNAYDLGELLFTAIKDENYFYKCPDRLRLPLIFYLAHTASFYVNKMILAGLIDKRVNKDFEIMFETGVDEMAWDDTENYRMGGSYKWPSVSEVMDYRRKVKEVILDVIDNAPLELPATQDHPWWAMFMAIEHERIHTETTSVLIRQLPLEALTRPSNWKYAPPSAASSPGPNEFVRIPAGLASVGKPTDFPSYGWDNEYGLEKLEVPEFEVSKYLVSNREFYEFVKDGGYQRKELWTEEGWQWVEYRKARHPMFWVCDEGCKSGCGAELASYSHCNLHGNSAHSNGAAATNGHSVTESKFKYRAIYDVIDMPWDWPVDVNYHEAKAFCSWKGSDYREYRKARHPMFWVCDEGCKSGCGAELASYSHCNLHGNGAHSNGAAATNGHSVTESKFKYRAIYDVIDMPWDWPVDVNYHEAKAFCSWKGPDYRLPTEAEHHRMRGDGPVTKDTSCDPGYRADYPANINLKYGSSTPVNLYPPTSMGVYDVYGNVWEWTEDHFNGLPGFSTTFLYDDFSTPCFDGRHTVIMGGSWISTGAESSRFARFAFRRHFIQHEGFRLVRSANPTPVRLCDAEVFVLGAGVSANPITTPAVEKTECMVKSTNVHFQYETEQELERQLWHDYGKEKSYAEQLVNYAVGVVEKYNGRRGSAVNFGSGTGISSFLLSKNFEDVVGVEYCGRFTDAALQIQEGRGVVYTGEGGARCEAKLPQGAQPNKVVFKQMTWVPNEIDNFDFVLFEFLDRLAEPKGWFRKLWESVSPRALVVFAASHNWDKERIDSHIGKWFNFLEKTGIDGKVVTAWQKKQ